MDAVRGALQRDRVVEGEFTGWIAPLERVLLKKDKYLEEAKPVASATPPKADISAPAPSAPPKPAPKPAPPNSLFAEKLQAVLEPHK